MKRFRGGLVFKAHRLLYHSTLVSSHKEEEEEEGSCHNLLAVLAKLVLLVLVLPPDTTVPVQVHAQRLIQGCLGFRVREFIDYKTSMTTY